LDRWIDAHTIVLEDESGRTQRRIHLIERQHRRVFLVGLLAGLDEEDFTRVRQLLWMFEEALGDSVTRRWQPPLKSSGSGIHRNDRVR
jgi:hypothetical protein